MNKLNGKGIQLHSADSNITVTTEEQIAKLNVSEGLIQKFNQAGIVTDGHVWGVRIDLSDSNPATCVTPTDDLVEMSIQNFGERPCLFQGGAVNYYLNPDNFNLKEDGTPSDITSGNDGDVMIEIPKMAWMLYWETPDILIVKLTNSPHYRDIDSRLKAYAHTRDEEGDRELIYIGAYQGWIDQYGSLKSLADKIPETNKTLPQFRTAAHDQGEGYETLTFYQVLLLQIMYLMKYRSLDSQTVLGKGKCNTGSKQNTGGIEEVGMYYGTQTETDHVKFAGIEDWYGNLWQMYDGLYIDANFNVLTSFADFNDTGDGYTHQGKWINADINDFLKKPCGTTEVGFLVKEVGGTSSTYFCDAGHQWHGCPSGAFGGYYNSNFSCGAFALGITKQSNYSANTHGSRLSFY